MGRIIVEVMPRQGILDPQGKALVAALERLELGRFEAIRQGRRIELEVAGEVTEADLAAARQAAEVLLANPNTEDVTIVKDAS